MNEGDLRRVTDHTLRRAGYSIYQRPRTGPAMWRSPGGRVMTEEGALREARRLLAARGVGA